MTSFSLRNVIVPVGSILDGGRNRLYDVAAADDVDGA
jgi:hypothetical protein